MAAIDDLEAMFGTEEWLDALISVNARQPFRHEPVLAGFVGPTAHVGVRQHPPNLTEDATHN